MLDANRWKFMATGGPGLREVQRVWIGSKGNELQRMNMCLGPVVSSGCRLFRVEVRLVGNGSTEEREEKTRAVMGPALWTDVGDSHWSQVDMPDPKKDSALMTCIQLCRF